MAQIEEIFSGSLTANAQNNSAFFSGAEFLFLKSSDHGDWSVTGDFTEIDFDLLVTVQPNVKRRIPLGVYASTREVIAIPEEFSRSGLLMEVVMQASFAANLQVFAVRTSEPVTLPELEEQIRVIKALIDIVLLFLGVPNLPSLPGAPDLPQLPAGQWFNSLPGGV